MSIAAAISLRAHGWTLSRLWRQGESALPPALCLALVLLGVLADWRGWDAALALAFYAAAYLAGGVKAARKGLSSLLRDRVIDVDLLMVLAALGAAVIGQWQEGAVLLFLFSLSNALQEYALDRTRRAIARLMDLRPDEATVTTGGVERRLPVEAVGVGDLILVRPGERLPLDGTIVAGMTTIDQAPITGESVPVSRGPGEDVFAATINQDGAITVRVTKTASESTLARIIALVEEAQVNKAPTQRWVERFEQRYALAVIGLTLLAIVVPPLLLAEGFAASFYRAMTLLVVASPCALVISTPAAVLSAIANAARRGILFKGGAYLEAMADLRVVALDKTGTLTVGRPRVTDIVPLDGATPEDVLRLAATVERHSDHPIATALVRAAAARGLTLGEPEEVQAVPGRGLRGLVEGQPVLVGKNDLFVEAGAPLPPDALAAMERLRAEGKTAMAVAGAGRWGVIGLADTPRPAARHVIQRLRQLGIKRVVMLTGDHRVVAETLGDWLGVDEVKADLLPHEKQQVIVNLVQREGRVAMIGDGVNDAPALATASIGVAMGAAGTDVALETADVVLMADDLNKLVYAIDLSRRTRRIIVQNLSFSLLVIVSLIAATLFGVMTLPVGVLGHEGSTVLVVLNGLRLLFGNGGLTEREAPGSDGMTAAAPGVS